MFNDWKDLIPRRRELRSFKIKINAFLTQHQQRFQSKPLETFSSVSTIHVWTENMGSSSSLIAEYPWCGSAFVFIESGSCRVINTDSGPKFKLFKPKKTNNVHNCFSTLQKGYQFVGGFYRNYGTLIFNSLDPDQ